MKYYYCISEMTAIDLDNKIDFESIANPVYLLQKL